MFASVGRYQHGSREELGESEDPQPMNNTPSISAIVQPLPLAKLAYERLRESILSGQMKPGEVYNEMALATEMGVSRTPVREALLELASQGLVTFLPRKGVMVNYFTYQDALDFFELRKAIELAVVEKVTANHGRLNIQDAANEIKATTKAAAKEDREAFLKADRAFHIELARLAGNRRMTAVLNNLRDLISLLGLEALSKPERMREVLEEHERIFQAVEKGEFEAARAAMIEHLDATQEAVLQQHHFSRNGIPPA